MNASKQKGATVALLFLFFLVLFWAVGLHYRTEERKEQLKQEEQLLLPSPPKKKEPIQLDYKFLDL